MHATTQQNETTQHTEKSVKRLLSDGNQNTTVYVPHISTTKKALSIGGVVEKIKSPFFAVDPAPREYLEALLGVSRCLELVDSDLHPLFFIDQERASNAKFCEGKALRTK